MDRQSVFPHPLMRLPRPGDREIRAKDARVLPIVREKEEQNAAEFIKVRPYRGV